MKTLTVDDFYLPLDGAVRVRCDVPASQNGLSAGFLEEKVTFDPPVEFTVGQEDEKCFLLYVEDGKNLKDAGSKSAITTATTTTKRWWIPTSPHG